MRIIEQTGALDVEATLGGVLLVQHDVRGGEPARIFIPALAVGLFYDAMKQAVVSPPKESSGD